MHHLHQAICSAANKPVRWSSASRSSASSNLYFAYALQLDCCYRSWKVPPGVFQAYSSYWPEGYIAHLAWAAAWMCKYDASMCPTADKWFNNAMAVNNLRYGLGYDW